MFRLIVNTSILLGLGNRVYPQEWRSSLSMHKCQVNDILYVPKGWFAQKTPQNQRCLQMFGFACVKISYCVSEKQLQEKKHDSSFKIFRFEHSNVNNSKFFVESSVLTAEPSLQTRGILVSSFSRLRFLLSGFVFSLSLSLSKFLLLLGREMINVLVNLNLWLQRFGP